MSTPTVSVVIPCYNAEACVGEAIQSALDQTANGVEVIVVDDGSSDRSRDVVTSFGTAVTLLTQPHAGGGAARNRGLRAAKGRFIQFLDADDLLHPTKVEKQLPILLETDAGLSYCDGERVAIDTGAVLSRHVRRDDEEDAVVFALYDVLLITASLHRKEHLLNVGGFREHLPCAQERDLHLRLACEGITFRHFPETLFTARARFDSISANYIDVLDQHADIAWHAYGLLKQQGLLTERRARAFAGFLARDARHYLQRDRTDTARDYFEQARRMHRDGGLSRFGPLYRMAARVLGPIRAAQLAERRQARASERHP